MPKKNIRSFSHNENGAATIVEYTIVLPICFLVIALVMILGFYFGQKALLDSVCTRSVWIVQKIFADANFGNVATNIYIDQKKGDLVGYLPVTTMPEEIETAPYRFLLGNTEIDNQINYQTRSKIADMLKRNQMNIITHFMDKIYVDVDTSSGVLKKSTITITQTYKAPVLLIYFGFPRTFIMEAQASIHVSSPSEMIRNADFVSDVIERYSGSDIRSTMIGFFDKISSFFDTTK